MKYTCNYNVTTMDDCIVWFTVVHPMYIVNTQYLNESQLQFWLV